MQLDVGSEAPFCSDHTGHPYGKYGPDKQTGILDQPCLVSQGNLAKKSRVVTGYPITRQHLWSDLLGRWMESSRSFWEVPAWWTSGNRNNLSHTLKLKASYDILNRNFLNSILQRYRIPGLVIHLWMSASLVSTLQNSICTWHMELVFTFLARLF